MVTLEDGTFAWIPEVNDAMAYEQSLQDYGQQDDGTYCFSPISEEDAAGTSEGYKEHSLEEFNAKGQKLPANRFIFTDWVNLKFAYSQTNGLLNVLDLQRCTPVKPFHIREYLDAPLTKPRALSLLLAINSLRTAYGEKLEANEEEAQDAGMTPEQVATSSVTDYITALISRTVQRGQNSEITFSDDFRLKHLAPESSSLGARPVFRLLARMKQVIVADNDKALRFMSVVRFIEMFAQLQIVVKYAPQFSAIADLDDKKRQTYLTQGEDPNRAAPDPLPFVASSLELRSHQFKAENLMRGSPQLAAYMVAAGGGKTIMTLTNILREMKEGKCKRPIIMCPSGLIQIYVAESVEVTEGRVNLVCITGYTVKMHGYERLQKMIETAPPNTIFLTDFDFLSKQGVSRMSYGTKPVSLFKNVEFLRQFKFDLIFVDECHFLKNPKARRTEAAHRLLAEIPYKRIESGTMMADTPVDIVQQSALLDPTIFGNVDDFLEEYAESRKGDKARAWKAGAGTKIMRRLQEHVIAVNIRRKEWAAFLPKLVQKFIQVQLSDKQYECYQEILNVQLDKILEDAATNPKLKKALENAEDETQADKLLRMLNPYLARLDMFVVAPGEDELGALKLSGDDLVSPKIKFAYQRCEQHLASKSPGKVLIFTSNHSAVDAFMHNLPASLQGKVIHYTATKKLECRAQFTNDDSKRIMVGIESSMREGLNFQMVSRLIRLQTVWTPGAVEQGNARMLRPIYRKADNRPEVYIDWVVADRTIDVTKSSRLVSKMVTVAQFEEHDNPRYQMIPSPPIVPMKLDAIRHQNDFSTVMSPYLESYSILVGVQTQEYQEYHERFKDKALPVPVEQAGMLPGSKLMAELPYVPEMSLYGTDDLGLIRYDDYIRQYVDLPEDIDNEASEAEDEGSNEEGEEEMEEFDDEADGDISSGDEEEDDSEDDASISSVQRQKNALESSKVNGLGVHCEFGDGVIYAANKRTLKIRLANGSAISVRKMACYVITKPSTNNLSIRQQLLKASGDIPIADPVDVPPAKLRVGKKLKEKLSQPTEAQQVELYFTTVNDYLAIGATEANDPAIASILATYGFRLTPKHYTAVIKTPKHLVKLFSTWKQAGFFAPKALGEASKALYDLMLKKASLGRTAGWATKLNFRNFLRVETKSSNQELEIKPYPIIRRGIVTINLPVTGQSGTLKAIQVHVSGVTWTKKPTQELLCFVLDKAHAINVLKKMLEDGVQVSNMGELKKQFNQIKIVRRPQQGEDEV
jgi:hypothetical protein